MDVTLLSSGSNRFSPKQLKSSLQDVAHGSLMLAAHASIINRQPLIAVSPSAARLTQAARDCQIAVKKQAHFYSEQMMAQLIRILRESEQAAGEQIDFSERVQHVGLGQQNEVVRKTMAEEVNHLSSQFNRYYVAARELSEESVRLSGEVAEESSVLSESVDQYAKTLNEGRESAQAIMVAVDLLEETVGKALDDWVDDTVRSINDTQAGLEYTSEEVMAVIERNTFQRTQLYYELGKISRLLVGVKTIECQLSAYSRYMDRLYLATKRLAVNWGKISNDFAIQAHQLGSQSDSNQLFKVLTSDIPVAAYYWRLLADGAGAFKNMLSERSRMFPLFLSGRIGYLSY